MNKNAMNMVIKAIDNATPTLRKIGKGFGTLKNAAGSIGGAFKSAFTTLAKFGAVAVGTVGGGILYATKQASDFNETLSKTNVVLGEASAQVITFAQEAAGALGISNTEALNAASTFAIFGKSANLSGDKLAKFSTGLTTLAADFGSFYNVTNDEAITAIGAALRGESEPIRRFGILLNDATLKNRAFAMGLIKTTKGALTPQNKVLAAQAEILAQAEKTGSMGDFARTLGNSLPNQLKVLRANFDNLTMSFGKEFLPVAQDVVSWVNKDILPGIKKLLPQVTEFAKGMINAGGAIASNLLPTLGNLATGLANTFGPMIQDNITNLTKPGGVFDSIGKVVGPIFDTLGEKIGGFIGKLTGPDGLLTALGNLAGTLWGDGKGPLAVAVQAIGALLGTVVDVIAAIAGGIAGLINAINEFLQAFGKAAEVQRNEAENRYRRMAGLPPVGMTPTYAGGNVGTSYGTPEFKVYVGQKEFDATVRDSVSGMVRDTGR